MFCIVLNYKLLTYSDIVFELPLRMYIVLCGLVLYRRNMCESKLSFDSSTLWIKNWNTPGQ